MSNAEPSLSRLAESFERLDQLLAGHAWLWRPQPFKQVRPAWCLAMPELANGLLGLPHAKLTELSYRPEALLGHLARWIPRLRVLHDIARLPTRAGCGYPAPDTHFDWAIPGRKLTQIQAFAGALGPIRDPVLEWCGGKGHLGRLLAATWGTDVVTLEQERKLCADGERLARRAGVRQRFQVADALAPLAAATLSGRRALALHACGELHRTLVRRAAGASIPALDIAPCCYHLGAGEHYQPLCPDTHLTPTRDDLRLAVNETVTARPRELPRRDLEMAWKLGYDLLRRETTGLDEYRPIRPVDKGWLRLGFPGFCRALAERDGLDLGHASEWVRLEREGWRRQRECMRLNLVRQAFRRPLELWLVYDLALHLARQGYTIELGTFCPAVTTPRNILLSARQ